MNRNSACVMGWFVLLGVPAGCAKPLNAIDPAVPAGVAVISIDETPTASVTGLSRADWPGVKADWKPGRVSHEAAMPVSLHAFRVGARRDGSFPTVESVSDEQFHRRQRAAEGLLGYPHAVWTIAATPWEIVKGRAPWVVESSPGLLYDRTPAQSATHDIGVTPVTAAPGHEQR